MILNLIKASGMSYCRGDNCKRLPEYIKSNGRIIKNTTCVAIHMHSAAGYNTSYYCRDCIDQLYLQMKTVLNSKLWIIA